MAYYDDDFQGYAIGSNMPLGSWVLDPSRTTAQIVAGGSIIPATDRHLFMNLSAIAFAGAGYLASFSEYVALYLDGQPSFAQQSLQFANGPNGLGVTSTLLTIKVEADSTISAYDGTGALLGNSGDYLCPFYQWNFLQVNVTLSDVLGFVHIALDLGVNGQTVLSFSKDTGVAIAGLTFATSQVNRFRLLAGEFGAFTLDTLSAIAAYPHAGSPKAIAFQAPIEVNVLPDDAKVTVFQAPIEVDVLPDTGKIQVYQMVIEVDMLLDNRWYISES